VADGLPEGLSAADMKKQNRERIMKDFNWPDIISRYEQFIVQCLTAKRGSTEGQTLEACGKRATFQAALFPHNNCPE